MSCDLALVALFDFQPEEHCLRPRPHVCVLVLKTQLFFVSRKIASTRSIFESFLPVHTNALYHFKNAKKPVVVVDERVVITSLILKEVQAA